MFLYSEKDFNIQRNIFLFRENVIIFRVTFSYSEEVLYSVNFFVYQKIFIFKEILLCSVTFWLLKNFVFKETFYIQRKSLCSEKIFIFIENVDVQRKCVYLEKTTNLNFKLFDIQLSDFGRYTWYKERKLKQWLRGNWPDSTMLASNEGSSRGSTHTFFEELSRLAEEL